MTIRHAQVTERDRCLVAFAIGRRTGTAVVRNRIRRRLRAALADLALVDVVPAGAMVITAGPSVAEVSFGEVKAHLARAVTRASAPAPSSAPRP